MSGKYDDIIMLGRPELRHPRMGMTERAAQFNPFAALTGYDAMIEETARLTQPRIELSQSELEELDRKFHEIHPGDTVQLCYYEADPFKEGGAYINVSLSLKKIDPVRRVIIASDRWVIPMDDVISVSVHDSSSSSEDSSVGSKKI